MNFYINNAYNNKSYSSSITSENQHKDKDTDKLKKKKQIISEKQGKYYCTYVVDEKGQKVLLNKVPISQMEKQKVLENSTDSGKTKSCHYNANKNHSTAFQYKREMHMEATHRKNLQEVMNILKGNVGIATTSKKLFGY
ncbi:hypothetical protein [Clostridium tetanomorphum]|uniref:Uncharacterized protein n=1 Tax=Clostridium tetanomorphum TaxID=1553 RepID=A0A923J045_CLOTT|nr:hypothetical protein [Clostridium tetanomorphum]MBC2397946.1 hypothetical protein [Clostridium tetanomorphum]NRZ97133.1 lipopolysaccharide export LptBFGC system permease protein LptF [Clostridium tetanomorphum]